MVDLTLFFVFLIFGIFAVIVFFSILVLITKKPLNVALNEFSFDSKFSKYEQIEAKAFRVILVSKTLRQNCHEALQELEYLLPYNIL